MAFGMVGAIGAEGPVAERWREYVLDHSTPTDAGLQRRVEAIDAELRGRWAIPVERTAVGVLDLKTLRLAMVRPDQIDYAASVPKIAIMLAWFHEHPEAGMALAPEMRRDLGLMIKQSDNAIAARLSQEIGLKRVQAVLNAHGFYDASRGGGIWMGKHYGRGTERHLDPVGGHSHAATVRQLLRFYLLLEQERLVSPEASRRMREIMASPEIPHREDKFVRGLAGRGVDVRRKAGWWEAWAHDTAIVTGRGRHYVVVAMTQHQQGDDYLAALAAAVDDVLTAR